MEVNGQLHAPAALPPGKEPGVQIKANEMDVTYSTHERDENCIHTVSWLKNLKGRTHQEDLGVDGKVVLERILGKESARMWTGCIWLRIRTSSEPCEHSNEPSVYVNAGSSLTS
jgi:hypothetical protein